MPHTRHLLESAIDDTAQQELILFAVSAGVAVILVVLYYFIYARKDQAPNVFSTSYREVELESNGEANINI